MIPFLQNFFKTAEAHPDRIAVVDREGERATTYRELLSSALRVNAWIRQQGLARESVCAIYFPKSMEYIAARLGIIMAGCAWVGLEDLMGKERMSMILPLSSICESLVRNERENTFLSQNPHFQFTNSR